jgi:GT2 family glycosyltransferase
MTKDKSPLPSWFGAKAAVDAPAYVGGNVDYAVLAFGKLILIGWLPNDAHPKLTRIRPGDAAPTSFRALYVRHAREDVAAQFQSAGRYPPFKAGFVATFGLSPDLKVTVRNSVANGQKVDIAIESEGGIELRFAPVPISLAEAMQAGHVTTARLQMSVQSVAAHKDGEGTELFVRLMQSLEPLAHLNACIDQTQTATGERAVVTGWVEGAGQADLLLVVGDLTEAPRKLDPIIIPRSDVSAHLRSLGVSTSTNLHGFAAAVEIDDGRTLRLCRMTTAEIAWSNELDVELTHQSSRALLGRIKGLIAESTSSAEPLSAAFHRLARAAIGQELPPAPSVSFVREFAPTAPRDAKVRTSVIVPFYGDAFYLLDHLMAQVRAPDDVEWIFVCDDPRLSASMIDGMSNRQCHVRQPTRLVVLAANGGFAHANNIGAQHARGDYLLLMNSDIYCNSFDFVDSAISLLAARADVGCIGFTLQFEDGTVQHDGMTFERVPWFDGLWASEHANKGMPQNWSGTSNVEVQAVTAALMMLRRGDFANENIFDPTYVVGDFEDADLCMRLRAREKKVALIRTGGLFHLERQSVRLGGDHDVQQATTHLNCLTFNDRWGASLDRNRNND